MNHTTLVLGALALAGCSEQATGSTASAVTSDPGMTMLRFHSPTGVDVEIHSGGTPSSQGENIYLMFDTIDGEEKQSDPSRYIIFGGRFVGKAATDPQHTDAAIAPLAAVLLGLATFDELTNVTGLVPDPSVYQPAVDPVPFETATVLVQETANYVFLKDGPAAGALANAWLAGLGVGPCPTGGP